MSHFELEFTPHDDQPSFESFQPKIFYSSTDGSPVIVADETARIMDKHFNGNANPDKDLSFLANQTSSLVYAARKGFLANMQMIRNLGSVNLNDLDALLRMNKAYSEDGPDQEETETFSRMYLAFGIMPDVATHEMMPKGYSRRGILQPPFTLDELYGRIYEVGAFVQGIIRDIHKKREGATLNDTNHPGVARTYWTFQTMGSMPARNPFVDRATLSDTIDKLQTKFQNPEDR